MIIHDSKAKRRGAHGLQTGWYGYVFSDGLAAGGASGQEPPECARLPPRLASLGAFGAARQPGRGGR